MWQPFGASFSFMLSTLHYILIKYLFDHITVAEIVIGRLIYSSSYRFHYLPPFRPLLHSSTTLIHFWLKPPWPPRRHCYLISLLMFTYTCVYYGRCGNKTPILFLFFIHPWWGLGPNRSKSINIFYRSICFPLPQLYHPFVWQYRQPITSLQPLTPKKC